MCLKDLKKPRRSQKNKTSFDGILELTHSSPYSRFSVAPIGFERRLGVALLDSSQHQRIELIMTKSHRLKLQNCLVGCLLALALYPSLLAQEMRALPTADRQLDAHFSELVSTGKITGAQLAVARDGQPTIVKNYGVVAVDSDRSVDQSTLFLIGSCSKPLASACVLSLIDDPKVQIRLTDPIDRWIPAYGSVKTTRGAPATRPPSVEELLSHRSGIYSHKVGMTPQQTVWIRRFSHTLAEAADGISTHKLIAQPGQLYAYSGAGYCVLGRVAEIASGQPFETILQQRLCKPLGLTRTTFFPAGKFPNDSIATGQKRFVAPHLLGKTHQMPLVGGSLYSTADEMSQFGQAVIRGWHDDRQQPQLLVSADTLQELTQPRSPQSGYSLGWKVKQIDGVPTQLSHSGSLQSYRARLVLDLKHRTTVAACWTLSSNKNPATLMKKSMR